MTRQIGIRAGSTTFGCGSGATYRSILIMQIGIIQDRLKRSDYFGFIAHSKSYAFVSHRARRV